MLMSNETQVVRSTAWDTCIASAAVANGAYSTSGNSSSLSDMGTTNITATQKNYPLLDFFLNVSSGTIVAGDRFDLYRVPSDGTTTEDFDTGSHPVGSFTLTGSGDADKFCYGVANVNLTDEWQVKAITTNSLTVSVKVQTRGLAPAA